MTAPFPRPLDPARAVLALIEQRDALAVQIAAMIEAEAALLDDVAWLEDQAGIRLLPRPPVQPGA